MSTCIVGWGHTRFGRQPDESFESLLGLAARAAMNDAGLEPHEIDEIFVGTFNPGLIAQDFTSALVLNDIGALRFKPATRVENACASGSAAIYQAANAIGAKRARHVLVIGCEKMTELDTAAVGRALLKASYVSETQGVEGGFAGVFANIAAAYFESHGDQSEALGRIAAKNHRNALFNPLAHMRQDLGAEFCSKPSERNPIVAAPLKRTDCALISDGAAALVLTDHDTARSARKAVALRGMKHCTDFLPLTKRASLIRLEGAEAAWDGATRAAGVRTRDLHFIELHDCFTISELLLYEALGLAKRGQGAAAILDGLTERDGQLPVNLSGGLKAKGHPIGATGVSMHVHAAMQLTGVAGDMQCKGASLGGVFNMGGVAVANYASVLEPVR